MKARIGGEQGFSLLELLIGCVLGMLVVAGGVELLRVHLGIARQLQTRLASVDGAAWALAVAARDAEVAGSDPTRAAVTAVLTASPTRLILGSDRDASGSVDPASAERVTLAWSSTSGGRFVRWLGNQSISIAGQVRSGGIQLRYFDVNGDEIAAGGGDLLPPERDRVRRVALALEVTERAGALESRSTLRTAAALRTRLEER